MKIHVAAVEALRKKERGWGKGLSVSMISRPVGSQKIKKPNCQFFPDIRLFFAKFQKNPELTIILLWFFFSKKNPEGGSLMFEQRL